MSKYEELDDIFKDSDYDSQDWAEWRIDKAIKIVREFREEDITELKKSWRTQTNLWKHLLVDISDELPIDVFVSIVLEILGTEEDEDLCWQAAVRCGFNIQHRANVVSTIKMVELSFYRECIKRLESFISKGYASTGIGEEVPLLKNLLLEICN